MVSIKELLKDYKEDLLEPIMVLSNILSVDKSYIYTYVDEKVSEENEKKFKDIMKKRNEGQPIQYLLGEKEFMGLKFKVEEGVLVPRNDTETLVEYLIGYIGESEKEILDIGMGSGAIALSLGHFCKNTKITGVDISEKAIKIAKENKNTLGLKNVTIKKSDLFKAVEGEVFDIIVSNPPYIPMGEISKLDREVKDYEPLLALDGGEDGLDFYRKITEKSKDYLKKNGMLIYEIGYNQSEDVKEILIKNNYKDIKVINDIQGFGRVVLGIYR